jgi:hypothetical protein
MSFLVNMASKFLPAIGALASKVMPSVTSAFAVGKKVLPQIVGAVGKVQHAAEKVIGVGKVAKQIATAVAPEITKKVENAYNSKIVGNNSIGDILEKGQKGLASASGVANQAKELLANIPPT